MISLERRFARLFRAYERADRDRTRLKNQVALLIEDQTDLEREIKRRNKADRARERATHKTFGQYLSIVSYSITRLARAGDREAADKMSGWLDYLEDAAIPVADAQVLIDLLETWCSLASPDHHLSIRTRVVLDDITGAESRSEALRELQFTSGKREERITTDELHRAEDLMPDV